MKAFSGADMTAYINHKQVGTLQALTISITREALPIYTMGNPDMRAVVRGKRGIAGTLVFTNFDRHALLRDTFADNSGTLLYGKSFGDLGPIERLFSEDSQYAGPNAIHDTNNKFSTTTIAPDIPAGLIDRHLTEEIRQVYDMVRDRILKYSDEIPEFDVSLTMVNESGDAAWATINGITLLNEGYGFTMDDLTSEVAYTFIARAVTPLTAVGARNQAGVTSYSR